MTKIRLNYVKQYKDRHGKARHYFRRKGSKSMALPGAPGSAEFIAAYQAALEGIEAGANTAKPGSLGAVIASYYASGATSRYRYCSANTSSLEWTSALIPPLPRMGS